MSTLSLKETAAEKRKKIIYAMLGLTLATGGIGAGAYMLNRRNQAAPFASDLTVAGAAGGALAGLGKGLHAEINRPKAIVGGLSDEVQASSGKVLKPAVVAPSLLGVRAGQLGRIGRGAILPAAVGGALGSIVDELTNKPLTMNW